jgi:hypothetical protein
MPATLRILAALDSERRAELEAVLASLRDAGFSVTVLPDAVGIEPPTGLGWRVNVDAPGYHAVARLRSDASPAEWQASLRQLNVGRERKD